MLATDAPTLFPSLSKVLRLTGLGAALILTLVLGVGCVGPAPVEDYALARTALDWAEVAGAPSSASGFWHKAEDSYRRGKKAFENREFGAAQKHFIRARDFAERAENQTRLKKFQSGEVIDP